MDIYKYILNYQIPYLFPPDNKSITLEMQPFTHDGYYFRLGDPRLRQKRTTGELHLRNNLEQTSLDIKKNIQN